MVKKLYVCNLSKSFYQPEKLEQLKQQQQQEQIKKKEISEQACQIKIPINKEVDKQAEVNILRDISVTFEQDKSYAIAGVSGTGKSTLLHLLAGFDEPTSGAVMLGDINLKDFSASDRAKVLGFVVQSPLLIKELSVYENITLAGSILGLSSQDIHTRAQELLGAVGLAHTKNWRVGALSGGQKQRIAVARALMGRPAFLLADEPTGNLDEKTGEQLIDLLLDFQNRWGMGLIICSHSSYVINNMSVAFTLKDGILIGA